MRAYGMGPKEWREDRETGSPSKHRKMTSKSRTTTRRIMHKSARNIAKRDIRSQIEE